MKIVLNKCYGGWVINSVAAKAAGLGDTEVRCPDMEVRTSPALIDLIGRWGADAVGGRHSTLEVIDLPANLTDLEISEYDGFESIIYVVDGKIHHA